MELETLLREISSDAVCGADLEYDAEFMALEQAARGKPEQQFGDTIVPAAEPDWDDVKKRAEALFARTKDLRVTVLLTRALLRQSDLAGLKFGLELLVQLISRYWESVYPNLEADEDNDPTMRLNALGALTDAEGFLRDMRLMNVVPPGGHGRLVVRDVLIAAGKLPSGPGAVPTAVQLEGIIRAAAAEHADSIDAARQSLHATRTLQTLLNEKLGIEHSLDLEPFTDILNVVVKACDNALGGLNSGLASEVTMANNAVIPMSGTSNEIKSREDSIRLLDRVIEFMERTEPSNPAPLLIRRAQRLISKNFMEIIEDLAPDSLAAIKGLAGLDRE